MVWNCQPPKKAGWYYMRDVSGFYYLVRVAKDARGLVFNMPVQYLDAPVDDFQWWDEPVKFPWETES